jgi:hypothetical protein
MADEAYELVQSLDISITTSQSDDPAAILFNSYRARWLQLETAINAWQPTNLTSIMSNDQAIAVTSSWYTLRRVTLLFHWRKMGFFSDVTLPPADERSAPRIAYMTEILLQVSWVLSLSQTKGYKIANIMLWPLAVVGSECCGNESSSRQQVRDLLQQIRKRFDMEHAVQVLKVLEHLWQQCDEEQAAAEVSRTKPSMESSATELGIALAVL